MKLHQNPLFETGGGEFDIARLKAKTRHARKLNAARREIRDLRRVESAAAAIADLDDEVQIHGLTRGQFSLLDLVIALLAKTGPAHLSISTWTAAPHEIEAVHSLVQRGDITKTRWLVDFSMARRETAVTHRMREVFGWNSIRVALVHCKFVLIQNASWRVVLRSSMNLNMNPRLEDFTVGHDPELAAFYNAILDEIFTKQRKELADRPAYEIVKELERTT
jgi:hypothetical protein